MTAAPVKMPAEAEVRDVSLTVRDLDRSRAFYVDVLGLTTVEEDGDRVWLGSGERRLVELVSDPEASRAPDRTGLYHFALLLPDRGALAEALAHLEAAGYPLQGAADHLVSEALYLADPEANGIELYRDRPPQQWPRAGRQVRMDTVPLDWNGLRAEARGTWGGLPPDTRLGHIHLRVHDITEAERFYEGTLGFDLMQRFGRGASFFGAGGYHHHVGVNTWESFGAAPPPPGALGLRSFTVAVPDPARGDVLVERLRAAGHPCQRRGQEVVTTDSSGLALALRFG